MKKFKLTSLLSFVLLLVVGLSFVSCSNETDGETTSASLAEVKKDLNSAKTAGDSIKIDTIFVVNESRNATINFNKEIKAFYKDGMTYNDLKQALDPTNSLSNMTPQGNALLFEAYTNIINKVSDNDMNGFKMVEALQFIAASQLKSGVVFAKDVNFESGSKELFGLDASYSTTARAGGCKWYQVGCLLTSLWNWLAADANGSAPGTTTNGQVLSTVVTIIGGMIGIGTSIFGGN
jgi:hypothetical protein